jgi:hypothetical protein
VRHAERGVPDGVLDDYLDLVDTSEVRSTPAPIDHAVHGVVRSFERGLDATVRTVPYVAADAGLASETRARSSEEHALDATGHDHTGSFHVGILGSWSSTTFGRP